MDKKINFFCLSIGMENASSHVTRIASKFYFRNQLSEREQIRQSDQFIPVCDKHKIPRALWTELPPCKTKRCNSELTTPAQQFKRF
jgi:hypothetical protein